MSVQELESKDTKSNTSKTKTNEKERIVKRRIQNKVVEQVKRIKYLEAIIDNSGKLEEEIDNRISKMTVYKTVFLPMFWVMGPDSNATKENIGDRNGGVICKGKQKKGRPSTI